MAFCRSCGTKLVDGSAFCQSCGAAVVGKAPAPVVAEPVAPVPVAVAAAAPVAPAEAPAPAAPMPAPMPAAPAPAPAASPAPMQYAPAATQYAPSAPIGGAVGGNATAGMPEWVTGLTTDPQVRTLLIGAGVVIVAALVLTLLGHGFPPAADGISLSTFLEGM